MPRIQEYNAPANVGLQPSEIGVEATAAAARRIGTFYHQEGQELGGAVREATGVAQKYLDHNDISHGGLGLSGLMFKLTRDLDETTKNSDPNDPTVVAKFMSRVEPQLQKFQESFQTEAGQKWGQERANDLRMHLLTHVSAEMSNRAGQAAVTNWQRRTDTDANTAYLNPAGVDDILKQHTESNRAAASAANLTGEQAGRIQTELDFNGSKQILRSAAQGYIDRGDNKGWRELVKRHPDLASGMEFHQLERQEDITQRSIRTARIQEENENRRLAEDKVNKDAWNVLNKNMQIDPNTGKMSISPFFVRDLRNSMQDNRDAPNAAHTFESAVRWIEERNRTRHEDIVTDPNVHDELLGRIYNQDKPTSLTEIWDAEARGKLNPKDATPLLQLVQARQDIAERDPAMRATLKGAQDKLNSYGSIPGTKIKMEMGPAYADFLRRFSTEYLRRQQEGTLKPNDLNLNDPTSFIRQTLDQFKPKPGEIMQDFNDRFGNVGGMVPGGGSIMSGGTSPAVPAQSVPTQSFTPGRLAPPEIGEVREGYRFKGGKPGDPKNWEKQ